MSKENGNNFESPVKNEVELQTFILDVVQEIKSKVAKIDTDKHVNFFKTELIKILKEKISTRLSEEQIQPVLDEIQKKIVHAVDTFTPHPLDPAGKPMAEVDLSQSLLAKLPNYILLELRKINTGYNL
jgi:hypothetical protein